MDNDAPPPTDYGPEEGAAIPSGGAPPPPSITAAPASSPVQQPQPQSQFPTPPPTNYGPSEGEGAAGINNKNSAALDNGQGGFWNTVGSYAKSAINASAAAQHGIEQTMTGGWSDTIARATNDALYSHFGIGSSPEQANQAEAKQTELFARYPKSTLVGDGIGLLSLMGVGAAAESLPGLSAMASKGFLGKVGASAIIGGGMNALLGANQGQGLEEHVLNGLFSGVVGAGLGAAGSVIGQGLGAMGSKVKPVAPATQQAAEGMGFNLQQPLSEQGAQYSQAAQSIVPNAGTTVQQTSQNMKDAAIKLLHEANLPDAYLSSLGIDSIVTNITKQFEKNYPSYALDSLKEGARGAYEAVKNLSMEAATNPAGKVSIDEVMKYQHQINSFFKAGQGDPQYRLIAGAFDDYLAKILNSDAFTGGEAARIARSQFNLLYGTGAGLAKNALSQIINKVVPTPEIANWAAGMSKGGYAEDAADVLKSIRPLTPDSVWGELQSLAWDRVAAPGALKGADLANRLTNYMASPIGQALHDGADAARATELADVLRAMPSKLMHAASGHAGQALSSGLLGYEGAIKGWESGEDLFSKIWRGAIGGIGGAAAGAVLPKILPAGGSLGQMAVPYVGAGVQRALPLAPIVKHTLQQQFPAKQQHGGVARAVRIARKYQEGGAVVSDDSPPPDAVPDPGTPPDRLPPRFGTGEVSPAFQKVTAGIGQGIAQQADIPRQVMQGTQATGAPDTQGRPMMTEEDAYRLNQTNQGASNLAADTAITMAGARAPFAEPGAVGIFGGRLSKTADLGALQRAQDMTAQGVHRDEIWRQTGWGQGTDGQWRYEISDQGLRARTGLGRVGTQLPHPDLQQAYPQLYKPGNAADVMHTPQQSGSTTWSKPSPLDPDRSPPKTFYDIGGPDVYGRRSVAAHELQHGVQRIEGFAPGSAGRMEAQQAFGEDPKWLALRQRHKEARTGGPPLTASELNDTSDYSTKAFNLYQRSAGETEARNTQARLVMTPEKRRQTPPWSTQDIPNGQQIVRNQDWLDSFSQLRKKPSNVFEPQAPAIRNQNTPLFDYSRLHEVPNVPQHDIPRVASPRGTPPDVRAMASPENTQRFNQYVDKGIQMGGPKWYNTMPLRDAFHEELGPEAGARDFARSMDYQSAASPDSTVQKQIPIGSYLYHANKSGIPLPQVGLSPKGNPQLKTPMPPGYGARAQALHVMNANDIAAGTWDPLKNPKPPSYSQNLQGNYQPVTIDRHNWRGWGGQGSVPKRTGYGFMEDVQQAEAAKKGLAPAQYQASGWFGGAEDTGVKSSHADPFLKTFENAVRAKAEQLGLPPQTVLRNYIRGQQPLRQGGAVARALSVARRYQ